MSEDYFFAKPIGMWVVVEEITGVVKTVHFIENYKGKTRITHPVSLDLLRYFNGETVDFSTYDVDLSGFTPFQQHVLTAARHIRWGNSITYSQLAGLIERPLATRAVGTALGKNRVPVIIPCHRVVSKKGTGGFSYGVEMKTQLLDLESIKV
ncbi:MAG: methylated-DNA--[protein]-cysteine S-methyltransferase [Methanosarcinales archaeon]|nr:methylated-DNA--[protein]-cysteine S-methyltransferase [Methanosarcinales archaeon]